MPHTVSDAMSLVLDEVRKAVGGVKPEEVEALGDAVLSAQAVFVTGEGRSGLIARCLAMRLMHLGLTVHVVGETVTPAFSPDDLLIVLSGSGKTAVGVTIASAARNQGGKVAVLTAAAESPVANIADTILIIPVAKIEQFGGSLFEQAALLVCDSLTMALQHRLGRSETDMRARHATLE